MQRVDPPTVDLVHKMTCDTIECINKICCWQTETSHVPTVATITKNAYFLLSVGARNNTFYIQKLIMNIQGNSIYSGKQISLKLMPPGCENFHFGNIVPYRKHPLTLLFLW